MTFLVTLQALALEVAKFPRTSDPIENLMACNTRRAYVRDALSSHMLVLSLRWYVERLVADRWIQPGRAVRASGHRLNKRWACNMSAARRVLGLVWSKERGYWLSSSYRWNLRSRIGLDLDDERTRAEFMGLPDSFPLSDEHTARFLEKHPRLLERCKEWLERPRERKTPHTKDIGMRRINARARDYLSELLGEE